MNVNSDLETIGNADAPGAIRVWLVDDNEQVRHDVATLVGRTEPRFRFEREFSSPPGLLDALSSRTAPDVILLDIQMGPYSGLDLVGPIKRLSPGTRVLMLTTLSEPAAQARAAREGASDFLLKCWSPMEIRDRILDSISRESAGPIEVPAAKVTPSAGAKVNSQGEKWNGAAGWMRILGLIRWMFGLPLTKATER